MESQAAVLGIKEIHDKTQNKVRVAKVCGDDDSSFSKVLKSEEEGGSLENKDGKIDICSHLSHRLKNMVKKTYELDKMAKYKSPPGKIT
jgi:hypothetical protein